MKLYANGKQVQGRTLGSSLSQPQQQMPVYQPQQQMPAYQPQPQSYSQSQTQYAMSPAPQADPFNTQRQAGMMAAAAKADPYAQYRGQYLQQLQQMSAPGYQFQPTDPSYSFRFKQGQGALESSLAARGLLGSGGAALELQQYGQEAGAQEFQAQFSRLQQLAGMGDPAAAARLEQEAIEGGTRTYQPQMMEAGRTVTDYGFPGRGGEGGRGSVGGGRGAERGRGKSKVASFLQTPEAMYFSRPGQMRAGGGSYDDRLLAARAQDIASGYGDTFPIEQMMPVGPATKLEKPKTGSWGALSSRTR